MNVTLLFDSGIFSLLKMEAVDTNLVVRKFPVKPAKMLELMLKASFQQRVMFQNTYKGDHLEFGRKLLSLCQELPHREAETLLLLCHHLSRPR